MRSNKYKVWDVLRLSKINLIEGLVAEDIFKICGILDSNSFRIDRNGTRGLFLATAMINHDCLPNSRVVFDTSGNVSVKAKKFIQKGTNITITYCTQLMNTPTRLAKLKKSKFFTCYCDLCCDPTEMGTYMSALTCPKCKGHLLPKSFHNANLDWTCNKCTFSTTGEKVKKLVDTMENNYLAITRYVNKSRQALTGKP
jgi:hypothetical protein